MKKNSLSQVILAGLSIMLVISSVALLHANKVEFIKLRFEKISDLAFSLYDTVLYISYLLSGIITGIASARLFRRKIFILTGSAGTALFSIILTFEHNSYPLLLMYRFMQGAFCVAAWQTLMTVILDLSGPDNRGRNMGIFGIFMAAGMGLAPVAGGLLAKLHLFAPYWAAAVQCTGAFFICYFFLKETGAYANLYQRLSIRQSLFFVKTRPQLVVPALYNFVDRLHMGFILFVVPLMLDELLGLGPAYRGLLISVNGLAYILLQYPIGRLSDMYGRLRFLVPGSLGYGLVLCGTGYIAGYGYTVLVAVFFLLGVLSGFTGPSNNALLGDYSSPEENPLAMGFFNFFGNIGIIFGPLLAGIIFSAAESASPADKYTIVFVFAGMVELTVLAVGLKLLRIRPK